MRNLLIKILSINPLLSLALVIVYVVVFWFAILAIWNSINEALAIVFALLIALLFKSQSRGLIEDLKRYKSQESRKN